MKYDYLFAENGLVFYKDGDLVAKEVIFKKKKHFLCLNIIFYFK
jgi:hypothetical protein